jgi:DNA replication protein DnaC
MNSRLNLPVQIGQVELPQEFGGVTLATLGWLKHHPEHPAMQTVPATCSKCGKPIEATAIFRNVTACDECRAAYLKADREATVIEYWRKICPPAFEETNVNHANFPGAQYDLLKDYNGTENLIFHGDTGTGKTRLAMMTLRRLLFGRKCYVGILWPEKLKSVKWAHDRFEMVEDWGRFELLLLDDSLLTGAQDERIADFLKDLIDYRDRYKRRFILTTQVGGEDVAEQLKKYGDDVTAADRKRIEALNRRIREGARVIPFPRKAVPAEKDDMLPF